MIDCQPNTFSPETVSHAVLRGVTVEMIIPSSDGENPPYFHLFMEKTLASIVVYFVIDGGWKVIRKYPWDQFPKVIASWDFSKTLIPIENWIDIYLSKKQKELTVEEVLLIL
ncbi:hypothetical protein [Williamwhitmania taraxaci]|uniref:Uncharacterized protein n=1 Tax=Williamwhitmania taraxaci TaxID=1640674 RepID=A0A1G6QW14_9BACT|nr:hypothetical protein [Williamwhitmania taraxaci]SDC96498.1 hypothetical protein SAMN05216323_106624 [Williamwhitmania taraxaci]